MSAAAKSRYRRDTRSTQLDTTHKRHETEPSNTAKNSTSKHNKNYIDYTIVAPGLRLWASSNTHGKQDEHLEPMRFKNHRHHCRCRQAKKGKHHMDCAQRTKKQRRPSTHARTRPHGCRRQALRRLCLTREGARMEHALAPTPVTNSPYCYD